MLDLFEPQLHRELQIQLETARRLSRELSELASSFCWPVPSQNAADQSADRGRSKPQDGMSSAARAG